MSAIAKTGGIQIRSPVIRFQMDRTVKAPMHLGYLDGLRAFAALYVFWYHALLIVSLNRDSLPWWIRAPTAILVYGHDAVNLFIVLSGFCLMLPVLSGDGTLRQGVAAFFKRRAWRILPPYYGAILLSAILIRGVLNTKLGCVTDRFFVLTAKGVFTHILMLQDAFGEDHTIDFPLWSVAVEWRIYFLFPLLLWGWRRFGALRTTLVTIAVSQCMYLLLRFCIHAPLSAHYLGLFAMGMLAATIAFSTDPRIARMRNGPWNILLICLTIAVYFLSTVNIYNGKPMPEYITDDFVGLASMALLVAISINNRHPLHRFLSRKPFVFVGTFAYSIYLIHGPMLQIFWQCTVSLRPRPLWQLFVLLVMGTPLVILSSYLFFLVCERPFLRKKIAIPRSLIAKTVVEPAP